MSGKKPKLYVQMVGCKTLVVANGIAELEPHLPDSERIQNHLIYERRACELDKERRPRPLLIVLENGIFNSVLREVRRKIGKDVGGAIHLVAQSGNLPICVVMSRDMVD